MRGLAKASLASAGEAVRSRLEQRRVERRADRQHDARLAPSRLAASAARSRRLVAGDHDLARCVELTAPHFALRASHTRRAPGRRRAEQARHRTVRWHGFLHGCARKRTRGTASRNAITRRPQRGVLAEAVPATSAAPAADVLPGAVHRVRGVSMTGCVLTVALSSSAGPRPRAAEILSERSRGLVESRAHDGALGKGCIMPPSVSPARKHQCKSGRHRHHLINTAPHVNRRPRLEQHVLAGRMRPSRTARRARAGSRPPRCWRDGRPSRPPVHRQPELARGRLNDRMFA